MSGDVQARPVRPFLWSVRRELWENRFVFIAPVAVAVLVVFAYLVGTAHLLEIIAENPKMTTPPAGLPFSIGAIAVVVTGMLTGAFYSLNALYAERRDRSILFWKSLPLSDWTVVLAKAAIPLVILPVVCFLVTLVMQAAMLGMVALYAWHGGGFPAFWTRYPLFQMAVVLLYCFPVVVLWHAPLYGWLFMVSAWAKRAPFLWAVLAPLALCVAEKVAFNRSMLWDVIADRLLGAFDAAFHSLGGYPAPVSIQQIAPEKFLTTPELWAGWVVAAGFFAAAVRLRRFRGPL